MGRSWWRAAWLAAGFLAALAGAQRLMGDLGLLLVEPQVNAPRAEQIVAYVGRPEPEDVLFLGSSRMRLGIDAHLVQARLQEQGFALSVYKLGMTGLRPPLLADVLADVVVPRPPRHLLVLGLETRYFVRPVSVQGTGEAPVIRGEWEADVLADDLTRCFRGVKALWHLPWVWSERTQRLAMLQRSLLGERIAPEQRARGEVDAQQRRAAEGREDQLALPPGVEWEFTAPDGPDMLAFLRCLDLLAGLPCPVLVVRLPVAEGFVEEQMAAVTATFHERIVPLVEQRGMRYEDLNRPPYPRGREHYVGETHLALGGSRLLSSTLVRELLVPMLSELGVERSAPRAGSARSAARR